MSAGAAGPGLGVRMGPPRRAVHTPLKSGQPARTCPGALPTCCYCFSRECSTCETRTATVRSGVHHTVETRRSTGPIGRQNDASSALAESGSQDPNSGGTRAELI